VLILGLELGFGVGRGFEVVRDEVDLGSEPPPDATAVTVLVGAVEVALAVGPKPRHSEGRGRVTVCEFGDQPRSPNTYTVRRTYCNVELDNGLRGVVGESSLGVETDAGRRRKLNAKFMMLRVVGTSASSCYMIDGVSTNPQIEASNTSRIRPTWKWG
jgi:hypothetical protein